MCGIKKTKKKNSKTCPGLIACLVSEAAAFKTYFVQLICPTCAYLGYCWDSKLFQDTRLIIVLGEAWHGVYPIREPLKKVKQRKREMSSLQDLAKYRMQQCRCWSTRLRARWINMWPVLHKWEPVSFRTPFKPGHTYHRFISGGLWLRPLIKVCVESTTTELWF